jgi:hypothetical protein
LLILRINKQIIHNTKKGKTIQDVQLIAPKRIEFNDNLLLSSD